MYTTVNYEEITPRSYTLNMLLDLLVEHANKQVVLLGTEYSIEDLISWRGDYYQPALTYSSEPATGMEIFLKLKKQLKQSHRGYKGGDFTFSANQEFYISNTEEAHKLKVCGYEEENDKLILLTVLVNSYGY